MIPSPKARTVISRSAEHERNLSRIIGGLTLCHESGGVIEPVGHILLAATTACRFYARRYLQAIGFVGWSFEHPAQAVRDRQARRHAPSVLGVELVVVDRVTALNRCALRKCGSVAGKIVN